MLARIQTKRSNGAYLALVLCDEASGSHEPASVSQPDKMRFHRDHPEPNPRYFHLWKLREVVGRHHYDWVFEIVVGGRHGRDRTSFEGDDSYWSENQIRRLEQEGSRHESWRRGGFRDLTARKWQSYPLQPSSGSGYGGWQLEGAGVRAAAVGSSARGDSIIKRSAIVVVYDMASYFLPHELLALPQALDAVHPGWVLYDDGDHPSGEIQKEVAGSQSVGQTVR